MVKVGKKAPMFSLQGYMNDQIADYNLDNQKGKWQVIFFYPMDFTFICPTEVTAISKHYDEFEKIGAQVWGVSIDSVHVHKAWVKELGGLRYPLLSDIKKEVATMYGTLIEEEGISLRATFVIDPDGIVKYHLVNDNNIGRNTPELVRVISALQTGELCPVDWSDGEKTLGKA